MGHLDANRNFVSDLTPAEVKECRARAFWLADKHFSSRDIESFDLGNIYGGYMTALVSTSYVAGQRRIWYMVNNQFVYTQRVDATQGVRRQAQDYYSVQLQFQRQRESARSKVKSVKETIR